MLPHASPGLNSTTSLPHLVQQSSTSQVSTVLCVTQAPSKEVLLAIADFHNVNVPYEAGPPVEAPVEPPPKEGRKAKLQAKRQDRQARQAEAETRKAEAEAQAATQVAAVGQGGAARASGRRFSLGLGRR